MLLTKDFKFDVKVKEAAGQFAGRASVYGVVDSYGDVVMPGAFAKHIEAHGNRIVVLNQHNPYDSIGLADLSDSDTALLADGQLELDLQSAKDAFVRVQKQLVTGISIGYEVMDGGAQFKNGIRELHDVKLWEISLVTFPANTFARVTDVKSALAQIVGSKDVDPKFVRALESIFTADVLAAFAEHKAGRVLSDSNRKKVQTAHGSLLEAAGVLHELLELTDPNADKQNDLKQLAESMRLLTATLKPAA